MLHEDVYFISWNASALSVGSEVDGRGAAWRQEMTMRRFLISEAGYVYENTIGGALRGSKPGDKGTRLKGHISSLLQERSQLGEAVRRWWPTCRRKLEGVGTEGR